MQPAVARATASVRVVEVVSSRSVSHRRIPCAGCQTTPEVRHEAEAHQARARLTLKVTPSPRRFRGLGNSRPKSRPCSLRSHNPQQRTSALRTQHHEGVTEAAPKAAVTGLARAAGEEEAAAGAGGQAADAEAGAKAARRNAGRRAAAQVVWPRALCLLSDTK